VPPYGSQCPAPLKSVSVHATSGFLVAGLPLLCTPWVAASWFWHLRLSPSLSRSSAPSIPPPAAPGPCRFSPASWGSLTPPRLRRSVVLLWSFMTLVTRYSSLPAVGPASARPTPALLPPQSSARHLITLIGQPITPEYGSGPQLGLGPPSNSILHDPPYHCVSRFCLGLSPPTPRPAPSGSPS